jgi:hypothetical protein
MDDGPLTPSLVLWVAKRVITQHSEIANQHRATGRCKQCRSDGCDMLSWAVGIVKANRVTTNQPAHCAERA